MLQDKLWIYNEISKEGAERLSKSAGISTLLSKVFLSRGMDDPECIKKFLYPKLENLYDPFLLKDMDRAVERIIRALNNREKIVIYGDYDVDGTTSTSVLLNFLSSLNADVDFYIPDRLEEGYGLSISALEKIRGINPSLVITVDCGISAFEEIEYLNSLKIDAVITDHHECKEVLPEAYAVVNPCRPDCTYPFKELAGVGVALKLVNALCIRLNIGDKYLDYLDLAAVGTVADVVPLVDENRIIVKHGIERIEACPNIGLESLIAVSGLNGKPVTSWGIAFGIAPRINAAGRTGDAGRAVRLFTTVDREEALKVARELNGENKFRQDTEAEIFVNAVNIVESEINLDKEKVIVVSGEGWHHGVIGIVASKITEKYYRPCIMLSNEEGICKGSGRSIEGFNLFKALTSCSEFLDKFGGHELAAGMTLKYENLETFRKAINNYAESVLDDDQLIPKVKVDVKLKSEDINLSSVRQLEMLAPFGAGNPSPIFAYGSIRVAESRTVGEDKHIKLKIEDNGTFFEAIGFNMGRLKGTIDNMGYLDLACSLEINTWNSTQKVQLNLKDIKPSLYSNLEEGLNILYTDKTVDNLINKKNIETIDEGALIDRLNKLIKESGCTLTDIVPERQDLVSVYQCIKANGQKNLLIRDLFEFAKKISETYKICMNYFKVKKSIEIFEELQLIEKKQTGKYGLIISIPDGIKQKVNLEDSVLYRNLQALKQQ